MINHIFQGLIYGMGISIMLGTVFFALLNYGQKYGVKAGAYIATGVVLSDLLFIGLALFLGEQTKGFIEQNKPVVYIVGGSLLLILAGGQYFGSQPKRHGNRLKPLNGLVPLGFVLNISNPVNFFIWYALHSTLVVRGLARAEQWTFLLASLLGIFLMEVLVALLANKILKSLSHANERRLQIIVAIVFLIAGISVVYIGLAQLF
jgi:threonine/homoserine/homoserine lactone efflux protein